MAAHIACLRGSGERVVVFPEMSLTGYDLGAPPMEPTDRRLRPLVEACAALGCVALVGAPLAGDPKPSIAVLAVDGAGVRVVYRKMWLSAQEARRFAPGTEPCMIDVDGWHIGMAVGRDVLMPEHALHTVALGIDVYAAGVVRQPDDLGMHHDRAAAIALEHGVWVALSGVVGDAGGGFVPAAGCSGVWASDGELAITTHGTGDVTGVTIGLFPTV